MFDDLHPESLANTIGWAVSTWYDRPDHIDDDAPPRHGAGLLVGARRARLPRPLPRRLRAPPRPRLQVAAAPRMRTRGRPAYRPAHGRSLPCRRPRRSRSAPVRGPQLPEVRRHVVDEGRRSPGGAARSGRSCFTSCAATAAAASTTARTGGSLTSDHRLSAGGRRRVRRGGFSFALGIAEELLLPRLSPVVAAGAIVAGAAQGPRGNVSGTHAGRQFALARNLNNRGRWYRGQLVDVGVLRSHRDRRSRTSYVIPREEL